MKTSKKAYVFCLFILISFVSCNKESSCEYYVRIIESNEIEANRKCQGYANNYPSMQVISTKELGCLTNRELENARLSEGEGVETFVVCSGVTATVRVKIVKK